MQQPQKHPISWKRNLAFLWLAQTCVATGFTFSFPFVPLFLQDMDLAEGGQAALWASIVQMSMALAMVLSGAFWGLVGDRYGRKLNVMRGMFGGGMTFILSAFSTELYHLIITRFLTGLLTGSIGPAMALAASTTPRERIPLSMGILQTAFFIGSTIGPLLGGLVADSWGLKGTFLVSGAMLSVGGVIAMLFVREEFHRPSESVSVFQRQAYTNLLRLLTSRELMPILITILTVQALPILATSVLPVILDDLSSLGGSATGIAFGVIGLSGGAGSYLGGLISRRTTPAAILRVALAGAALSAAPLFWANSVAQFYAFLALGGAFQGAMFAMTGSLVALAVSGEEQGVAFGGMQSVQVTAFSVGQLIGGVIGATAGLRWVFPVQALGLLGVLGLTVPLLPRAVSGPQRAAAETAGHADADRASD